MPSSTLHVCLDYWLTNPVQHLYLLLVSSYSLATFVSFSLLFSLSSLPLSFWLSSDPSLAGRERRGGGGRGAGRENGRLSLHGAPLTSQRYPGESETQCCLCHTSCPCLSLAGHVLTLQKACALWCSACFDLWLHVLERKTTANFLGFKPEHFIICDLSSLWQESYE